MHTTGTSPAGFTATTDRAGWAHSDLVMDELEETMLRDYLNAQCRVLTRRHPYEDFLLVRTLADQHQHAAWEAKRGQPARARVILSTLERFHPRTPELSLVFRVTADPAWALVDWTEGQHRRAVERLRSAMSACAFLADAYEHDYLTARRIYLASHIARVDLSRGAPGRAAALAGALAAVMAGAADQWPFECPETLDVPVGGNERLMLEAQLAKLRSIAEPR
ncbi:hypothetical protein [Jiangella asiatica]|uniref:Uncharacterized protein n=1 Tax=Jiangella asiatica TaxID=2530372 RepID=A0A4R5D7J3_9ACTN|nr:hypothetical protein [Jiangella asiatica]TDE09492.1 hypothetical protein E1269_14350 [Jiangella asiatica]